MRTSCQPTCKKRARIWFFMLVVGLGLAPQAGRARQRSIPKDEAIRRIQAAIERIEKSQPTGAKLGRLYERMGDLERKQRRQKAARRAYRQALRVYAAAGDSQSRADLLKKLSKRGRGWSKESAFGFQELRRAWRRVGSMRSQVNRIPRRLRPPEDPDPRVYELTQQAVEVGKLARLHQDSELLAWALEVEGRALAAAGYPLDEVKKYRQAAEACAQGACPSKRRSLLLAAARLVEERGELVEAYRLYTLVNDEEHRGMPKTKRRYARSTELVQICGKLRLKAKAPSCVELERQTVGYATFRDFSTGRPKTRLTRQQMRVVHAEYLPLLRACLAKAVEKDEVEPGDVFEVGWTVRNDGRAIRMECLPPVEGLELDSCLRQALSVFRYPRYLGERRNVSVSLSIE